MMISKMPLRLMRYGEEIIGLDTGSRNDMEDTPQVISVDELKEMMNSLEDGTILSVSFMKGGDSDE